MEEIQHYQGMEGFRTSKAHSPSILERSWLHLFRQWISKPTTHTTMFVLHAPHTGQVSHMDPVVCDLEGHTTGNKTQTQQSSRCPSQKFLVGIWSFEIFQNVGLFGTVKVPRSSIFQVWPWGLNLRFQTYYLRQQQIKPRSAWFEKWFVMNIYNLEARLNDGLRIIKATCQVLIAGYLPIAFNIISSWCKVQNPALMVPHL